MKSIDELVQELSNKTQSTDIPNLDSVSGLDFEAAKRVVVESNVPQEHLRFVYDATANYGEETTEAVVGLQFHYEVVHQLRVQLQKQFADAYLSEKKPVFLKREHLETFTHPDLIGGPQDSNLGYRYLWQPITTLMTRLSEDMKRKHKALLDNIKALDAIEIAYGNTIYGPVVRGTPTDVVGIRNHLFDELMNRNYMHL